MLATMARTRTAAGRTRAIVGSVTGLPDGPFPVGVTTMQFDDHSRTDPVSGGPRRLQTEIWYPAAAEAVGDKAHNQIFQEGTESGHANYKPVGKGNVPVDEVKADDMLKR